MVEKSSEIGLRKGRKICDMPHGERIKFIAEGLPIILSSADSLMSAAEALTSFPREAEILQGQAEEECSKILILLDIIRSPLQVVDSRVKSMMGSFYCHLARLLYAECQYWKPVSPDDLQSYINRERRSHFIEGYAGEYILPNWSVYMRESVLYADIQCDGENELSWHSPTYSDRPLIAVESRPYKLVKSLAALGAFTVRGLEIMHEVWGAVEFVGEMDCYIKQELTQAMIGKFIEQAIVYEHATRADVDKIYEYWQIPMYHMDFKMIQVSLEELKDQQERAFQSEFGDSI